MVRKMMRSGSNDDLLLVLVVLDWVLALGSEDKVGWNQLGTLVKKLEERVLSVGGWLTKENWASGVFDIVAASGDGLAIGLHGKLLKVSWESVEVLVESRLWSVCCH